MVKNVFGFLKSQFYNVSGFLKKFSFLNLNRIIVQKSTRVEQLITQTLKLINIASITVIS